LESIQSTVVVDARVHALEHVLGAVVRFLCSRDVNLIGALGRLGQDRDFVRKHFSEAPRAGQSMQIAAIVVSNLAHGKFGDEGCVSGKDSQIAVFAGYLNVLRHALYDEPLGSHDFEFKSIHNFLETKQNLNTDFTDSTDQNQETFKQTIRKIRVNPYQSVLIFYAVAALFSLPAFSSTSSMVPTM
jgi:hypothetical protein